MRTHPFHRLLASSLSGLLAAGGTPLWIASARADEPSRVLVLPFRPVQGQVKDELGPKVADIVGDELHNHDELQLAAYSAPAPSPAATPAAAGGAAPSPASGSALEQIEQGEAMVKHFKFKPAAEALEAALSDYEALPAEVDLKVLREAYTQLAMARMRSGDNEGGLDALATVVRLAPDQGLGGGYPPPFKRAFDQAKRKVLGSARTSVVIRGEGQVALDGKDQGAAPVTLQNIIPGAHFLRVQRPDGSAWGLKLIVGEGENTATIPPGGEPRKPAVAAEPAPTGAFAGIAANRIDDALLTEVASAAKEAGAAFVLFGGLYKAGDGNIGLAAHLYSVKAHGEVALKPIAFDADLVSTGIEANKLASEVVAQVKAFGAPEALPAAVTSGIRPKVAAVTPSEKPVEAPLVKPDEGSKKPLVVKRKPETNPEENPGEGTTEEKPQVAAAEPKERTITATPGDKVPAGGLKSTKDAGKGSDEDEGSSNVLFYGLLGGGAAVVAAGVVGTVLVVKNRNTPVTGSASLTFQ